VRSPGSIIVAAYRKLGNGRTKQLIKNVASFAIHRLSIRTEEVVVGGQRMRLYRNRLLPNEQLVRDILGYNLHYAIRPGDTVIDVGAYTGIYAIYAAMKAGPTGKVVAFEPDPYNRMMLKRNLRLNGLRNVMCIGKGLYDRETVVEFDVQGFGSHVVEAQPGKSCVNRVKVTTLDAEMRRLGVSKVDFVKMDIEGSEIEALRGCVGLIGRLTGIEFAVATYHVVQGRQTAGDVESFFRSHGMQTYSSYPSHLTTFAFR
jgi:FkbM family methyltransferase